MSGTAAVLLAGGGAVGAAPAPATPHATAPSTSRPALRVALPGLLTVTVDLPRVKLDLLGRGRDAAGGQAATPPSSPTSSSPAPSLPAPSLPAPSLPAPSLPAPSLPAPSLSASPLPGPASASARPAPTRAHPTSNTLPRTKARTERGAPGPRRVVTVEASRVPDERPASPDAAAPHRPVPPRPPAEAFVPMLRSGSPILLLAGIVGVCGLGTVIVVHSAGRRPSRAHRAS